MKLKHIAIIGSLFPILFCKIGMTVHAVKSTEIGMKVGNKESIVNSDSFYLGKCIFFQFYCFSGLVSRGA